MEFQTFLSAHDPRTVSALLAARKRRDTIVFVTIFVLLLGIVPGIVFGSLSVGLGLVLGIPVVLIITALVVRWPILGFFAALISALAIDQSPADLLHGGASIYVFYWPQNLQGLPDRPIGFLMLLTVLALLVHGLFQRKKLLRAGELLIPFLLFFVCVAWGVYHGLTTGGKLQIVIQEIRSFWYLLLGYLLAYNFIHKKSHVTLVLWAVIVCAAIKAFIALYVVIFLEHGNFGANRYIMAHEESYFWVSIILLIMLFALHFNYKKQFYAALAILPVVIIALIANNRRADYLALLVGMATAWALIFAIKPQMRTKLVVLLVVVVGLGGGYLAAFYNVQGGLGKPAQAVISVFAPTGADTLSNKYRVDEDYDLEYTVKLNPMGLGFGKQFLEPHLLPNIIALDPVYQYIPHNTIFWVWMRLGPLGYLAFWYLFGTIIVRGCIYARRLKDPYLQLVAIFVVCMVIMEILVAFADYQLSFYRNVIYVGVLAGLLMRLPALDKAEPLDEKTEKLHRKADGQAEPPSLSQQRAEKRKAREAVSLWF